ncbi:MAG: hypothetical protein WBN22_12760 [Verrucomicrobiia bacterium]
MYISAIIGLELVPALYTQTHFDTMKFLTWLKCHHRKEAIATTFFAVHAGGITRHWRRRDYAYPRRINWVMSMANQNVPICIIATPQFIERQIAARQFAGWNDAQFIGRLGHRERLPSKLSVKDLVAVAKTLLPEGDAETLRALAGYARTSARYLAAVDTIIKRARYLAERAGRVQVVADDVRKAMRESVIPSDTMLVRVLESGRAGKHRRALAADELQPAGSDVAETPQRLRERAATMILTPA